MTDEGQATAHPATAQPASSQAVTEPATDAEAPKPGGNPARNESVVTRLMRAGSDEVAGAARRGRAYAGNLSGEARDIARLVERRLAEVAVRPLRIHALDQLEIQRASLCTGSSGR